MSSTLYRLSLFCLLALNDTANSFTITTFNILAPVHRSMGHTDRRESEQETWWRPRAEAVASYISENLVSEIVCDAEISTYITNSPFDSLRQISFYCKNGGSMTSSQKYLITS
jgi:hypothetical protein